MRQVIPYLWFDTEAEEAVNFYTSLFDNTEITRTYVMKDTPSGDAKEIEFRLENLTLGAINGGPYFKLNPSISIMVALAEAKEVDDLYAQLAEGGRDLMPLDSYPFSERYAWVEDKFGLSWQLILDEESTTDTKLEVCMLFSGEATGKAQEALEYYQDVFENSQIQNISEYPEGEAADERAQINYGELQLKDQTIIAMDDGMNGNHAFSEAFSLLILCTTQAEIDYYWEKLSYVPEAEQCGWVKDQFGVSWQIVPNRYNELLDTGSSEEQARVIQAMLKMKKLDIEALENAKYDIS